MAINMDKDEGGRMNQLMSAYLLCMDDTVDMIEEIEMDLLRVGFHIQDAEFIAWRLCVSHYLFNQPYGEA